jgi:hypothetical protein
MGDAASDSVHRISVCPATAILDSDWLAAASTAVLPVNTLLVPPPLSVGGGGAADAVYLEEAGDTGSLRLTVFVATCAERQSVLSLSGLCEVVAACSRSAQDGQTRLIAQTRLVFVTPKLGGVPNAVQATCSLADRGTEWDSLSAATEQSNGCSLSPTVQQFVCRYHI